MSNFIILTAAQANQVRGPTIAPGFLDPIEHEGGWYILPAAVLDDPLHAQHRDFLLEAPQLDTADPSFPAALPQPDKD